MTQIKQANGYRLHSLAHLFAQVINPQLQPQPQDVDYELDEALRSIVSLHADIPADAYTASILGTEREGHAVLINENGVLLTIGYLIAEAESIRLGTMGGREVGGQVQAYDYETGFGLVRAIGDLEVPPLVFGSSADLNMGEAVVAAGFGGRAHAIKAKVTAKREFAGYWEYLLDEAIFTAPAHPNWGGTALLGPGGRLYGIGSLFVQEAGPHSGEELSGNMFVPIDLLKPLLPNLLTMGHANRPARPWLGMFTTEISDQLVVAGLAPSGPAAECDIKVGDIVVAVDGELVTGLGDMLKKIWALGSAGVAVRLTVVRDGETMDLWSRSANRNEFMKLPKPH